MNRPLDPAPGGLLEYTMVRNMPWTGWRMAHRNDWTPDWWVLNRLPWQIGHHSFAWPLWTATADDAAHPLIITANPRDARVTFASAHAAVFTDVAHRTAKESGGWPNRSAIERYLRRRGAKMRGRAVALASGDTTAPYVDAGLEPDEQLCARIDPHLAHIERAYRKAGAKCGPPRRQLAKRFHAVRSLLLQALAAHPDRSGTEAWAIAEETSLLSTKDFATLLTRGTPGVRRRQWARRFPLGFRLATRRRWQNETLPAVARNTTPWRHRLAELVAEGASDRTALGELNKFATQPWGLHENPATRNPGLRTLRARFAPDRQVLARVDRRLKGVLYHDAPTYVEAKITTEPQIIAATALCRNRAQYRDPETMALCYILANPATTPLSTRERERLEKTVRRLAQQRLDTLDATTLRYAPQSIVRAAERYGLPLRATAARVTTWACHLVQHLFREEHDAIVSALRTWRNGAARYRALYTAADGTVDWKKRFALAEHWSREAGIYISAAEHGINNTAFPLDWRSPALPEPPKCVLTVLDSYTALIHEGKRMEHCAADYLHRCLDDGLPSHLYHLEAGPGQDSTFEVQENVEKRTFRIVQHAARGNTEPSHNARIAEAHIARILRNTAKMRRLYNPQSAQAHREKTRRNLTEHWALAGAASRRRLRAAWREMYPGMVRSTRTS